MELTIIIVNYRSKEKLTRCLDSIIISDLGDLTSEIILVDNNSGDHLSDLINLFGAKVNLKLINSQTNLGMGGGNNLGINAALGKYILILNPDTIVKDRALLTLLDYLRNNQSVALVGPKLLNSDGSLQSSCSHFPIFFMPILRRTFLGDYFKKIRDNFTMNDFDHNSIKAVDWLMGSCLMFKKEIILKDGNIFKPFFDKRYFMYFEDIDLCRQIWAHGFQVVYNPEAILIHDHRRESAQHPWYLAIFLDKLSRRHVESWLKYFIKWTIKKL